MNKEQNVFKGRFNEIVGADATQEEIAQKIGTSRQNVGNWLSGRSKPDIFALKNIAQAYGVSTDYLLGISGVKTSDAEKKVVCEYAYLTKVIIKAVREEIAKLEKHAHWNVGYFHDRVCSRCCHPDNDIDEYPHQYCPNCGAKMGEENI